MTISDNDRAKNLVWMPNDVSHTVAQEAAQVGIGIIIFGLGAAIASYLLHPEKEVQPTVFSLVLFVILGWISFGVRFLGNYLTNPTEVAVSDDFLFLKYRGGRKVESIPWQRIQRIEHQHRSKLTSTTSCLLKLISHKRKGLLLRMFRWKRIAVTNEVAKEVLSHRN